MQIQESYQEEISKLFDSFNPKHQVYQDLDNFLKKECRGSVATMKKFLENLIGISRPCINFSSFLRMMRIIKKRVTPFKKEELELLLSSFLVQSARIYFPNYIIHQNAKKFDRYALICKGLAMEEPQKLNDQREIMIYLIQEKYSEQFTAKMIQKINTETIVDKKNYQFRSLKVNKFFCKLIVQNFDKIFPQLERLLVRSQNNIEIWQQFFASVQNFEGIDVHLMNFTRRIKNMFISYPENCQRIIYSATKDLSDLKIIRQYFDFVSALITGEHNASKKIVYVSMLNGLISCLSKSKSQDLKQEFFNEIMHLISNSLIKFQEEQEFKVIQGLLKQILPQIKNPSDNIAKCLKNYLKSQNKFILILSNTICSELYKKQHIDNLPNVKQIYNHYKSQLPTLMKKIEGSWQWILPALNFLSQGDEELLENLSENLAIFKSACILLTTIEKRTTLKLTAKYLLFLKKNQEQIPDSIFLSSAALLESIKQREIWKEFLSTLSDKDKILLLTKGIYPLMFYKCVDLKINKGNQFHSLALQITKSIKETLQTEEPVYSKLLVTMNMFNLDIKSKIKLTLNKQTDQKVKQYLNCCFYEKEVGQEQKISDAQMEKIVFITNSLLLNYSSKYLEQLFANFITEQFYQKDLNYLIQFQEGIEESIPIVKQQNENIKAQLLQKGFLQAQKIKPLKNYAKMSLDGKMMSEDAVKQEKYRKHFERMTAIYLKLITFIEYQILRNKEFKTNFWKENFQKFLKIGIFPEHRMGIYKIVHKSFLLSSWENRKAIQSKVFYKYSEFFADFFCFRYSKITPSINLMQRSENFLKEFLNLDFQSTEDFHPMISNSKQQFIMLFINQMCEYILENMEFDINLKKLSIKFYHKCIKKQLFYNNEEIIYTSIVKNINILSGYELTKFVLGYLITKIPIERYKQMFEDILNYIQSTKKMILQIINETPLKYYPQFEEYIKLKILSQENNKQISDLSFKLLSSQAKESKSIASFNMKNFVKKNSKETIEKLCVFIKESINEQNRLDIFLMVIKASQQLYDENFDQQGLQMFPFFLRINLSFIDQQLFKPIFQLLVMKFTSKEEFATLSKMSLDVGIEIIKLNADKSASKMLTILEEFINKAKGVSNIIFLGVLAPYLEGNKNIQAIQKRITELFKSDKQSEQKAISKCIPQLMSFFKNPEQIIQNIFSTLGIMPHHQQKGQSYLMTGLLKGIGYKITTKYIQKLLQSQTNPKDKNQKFSRIYLLNAMVQNFGRLLEINSIKIIQILIGYMGDGSEEIRNESKKVAQVMITRMSSYSVKMLLPELLKGLEEQQQWRVQISYIWMLGVMANCSAKQLQTSLPIIVPTLSNSLRNAHPTIREKAAEALNLIGETIQNPQISTFVDILIDALQNPFEKSQKALQILLKTRFSHYIDPPSLSIIIPILDYCMRGRSSDLKSGSCQVIGSIVELVQNSYDLLPYLQIITTGLKISLCDAIPQIRSIASMAVGRIAAKIGIEESESYFKFIVDVIQSSNSNTTERNGAAQAYSELICSQNEEYFEESLNRIFERLNQIKHSDKQGYILVFLYVPTIRTQEFQSFIKEVNENMYTFVSDEDESIRNSAMAVEKILINNYCLSHTDLLLDPLCAGIFESNWKKRNAALILIGQLLNIIKSHIYNTRTTDKNYAYYRGLMAVYVLKDDELQMPRHTANQVWNTYIQNTPKTIKLGLVELVKMWTRWTHCANGVVFRNIQVFSGKYGENYFTDILDYLVEYLELPQHQIGVFEVLSEFIKKMSSQFLSKEMYKEQIRRMFSQNLFTIADQVRPALIKCFSIYVQKMNQSKYFEQLLFPVLQKMDSTPQSDPQYTSNLHLLKYLLQTSSHRVVDIVTCKVMESPMSQFKIEVITNNADRLSNQMYSLFKRPATQMLIDEVQGLFGNSQKENRMSLIIYCLDQVSLHLNNNNKERYVEMLSKHIYNHIHILKNAPTSKKAITLLTTYLNMLIFFLTSTPLSELQNVESIIGLLAPLTIIKVEQLITLTHKIYLLLIANIKEQNTSIYLRQLIVAMENNVQGNDMVWNDYNIMRDYVGAVVKGVAYGGSLVMDQSLNFCEFMIKRTSREFVQKEIIRIVGPMIRILNYPLTLNQKMRTLNLILFILNSKFKVESYTNQILSVCLRLLQQFKSNEEVIKLVGETYKGLLVHRQNKAEVVKGIMDKINHFGVGLVQAFYYLVDILIKENVDLPKNLFEKIYEDASRILLHNEGKLSMKALYYASEISARVGVFMNKPIEKLEAQLTGITCPYEIMLNYLHFSSFKKTKVPQMKTLEIFFKESSHQKVVFLLQALNQNISANTQTRQFYTQKYLNEIIPENISGFDDIIEMVDYFDETEEKEEKEVEQADINKK